MEKFQETLANLVNPVCAVGSHPMISEATWLRAQAKLYQELGFDVYFDKLFEVLDGLVSVDNIPFVKADEKARCKEIGPFRYFPELMCQCKRKFSN
jgi:hypothetical protein